MIITDMPSGRALLKGAGATPALTFALTRGDGSLAHCTIFVTRTGATWLQTVCKDRYSIEPVMVQNLGFGPLIPEAG